MLHPPEPEDVPRIESHRGESIPPFLFKENSQTSNLATPTSMLPSATDTTGVFPPTNRAYAVGVDLRNSLIVAGRYFKSDLLRASIPASAVVSDPIEELATSQMSNLVAIFIARPEDAKIQFLITLILQIVPPIGFPDLTCCVIRSEEHTSELQSRQ